MKTLTLCVCVLAAIPLFAGKRIEMEVADLAAKSTKPQEMLLDATRYRMNFEGGSVMFLTDGGRTRIVNLNKTRNQYTEIDQQTMQQLGQQMQGMNDQMAAAMKGMSPEQAAQMKQMMEQMMKGKMPAAATAAPARTVYTSKGGASVNGFACTNYDGVKAGQKVSEVCAAQPAALNLVPADFEVFRRAQEFAANLTEALQNSPVAGAVNLNMGDSSVDGFPVRRTTFRNGQAVEQETIKAVTNATFTDADFSVGNAQKVEMPGIGGNAGKGKGKGK